MAWDHDYRRLNKGEIIRATDEAQNDDASWSPARCVGDTAPDPAYSSHRIYRRVKCASVRDLINQASVSATTALATIRDWD